jgi:NifU-like protein involved in Fe-S cluster formation
LDKNDPNVGTGIVGAPACGDVMKLQIQVDESGKIIDAKFKTFGCGSAIASSSLATEWIKGKTVRNLYFRVTNYSNFSWTMLERLKTSKSRKNYVCLR